MEWAKSLPVIPRLFELNVLPHHIDNIDAGEQVVDELSRNHALCVALGQLRFNHCGNFAHIGLARQLAFEHAHYFTHVLHARS